MERNISGRKLLTIQEFEFVFLIRDINKRRILWNLLQDIIHNRTCETEKKTKNFNMLGRGGARRPPERPRASLPHNARYPPGIDPSSRRQSQPPPHFHHHINQQDGYPYDDDEFEDCSEDDVSFNVHLIVCDDRIFLMKFVFYQCRTVPEIAPKKHA